jgi:hypothetical protein
VTKTIESVHPTGEQLVDVGLMTDIPDEPVPGRVEDSMEGKGQFHHTQVGRQMPAMA